MPYVPDKTEAEVGSSFIGIIVDMFTKYPTIVIFLVVLLVVYFGIRKVLGDGK